jgi:parallel beta-helix repeat protein
VKAKQLFISLILGLGLILALLWLLGGSTPSAHAGSPHYVAPDCTGVSAPCHTSIQEAVDAAVPGDEILVASGIYTGVQSARAGVTQVVYISKTITIHGGYTTTNWTTPYPITQPTTLDAQGQGRVLYITGDISPTIEGLRITGGNAIGLGGALGYDAGGGVYVISATATVSNNRVFSNTAEYGGGLFQVYGDATLSGNIVFSNTATQYGGGLCLGYSSATLSGNTVFSNTAVSGGGLGLGYSDATLSGNAVFSNTGTLYGGGLFLGDSPATLSGNIIASNTADTGGGLYLTGSDTKLTNNVVADNQVNIAGSGLYIFASAPLLLHTTVARNTGGDGSGVYITGTEWGSSTVAMTNTILVSHTVGITVTAGNTVTVNGVLWYGTPVTVSQAATATVVVQHQHEGNPVFAPGGYHLTADSTAIDQGVDAGVMTDIDGDVRPDGCFFDIGADEFMTGVACRRIYLPLIMRQYQ